MLELRARKTNRKVIHEQPQDIECERPQPMSKLRKLSDSGVDCQGGGTSSNLQLYKQTDQDSSNEVNTVATVATNGEMKRKDMKVKATQ